jgi:hypoxanthine-DNA glycosylase
MTDGFPPIADVDARVLILGTGPSLGVASEEGILRKTGMNGFWPIMASLWNEQPSTYADKQRLLLVHHIALWDVLSRFDRVGSLDSGYRKVEPNDLVPFISRHPLLKAVCFTGKTAEAF